MRKRKHGRVSSAWIRPELRWAVYLRDQFVCAWCGEPCSLGALTLDHLFPRWSRFRSNRIVTAHRSCNLSRKDQSVADLIRNRVDRKKITKRLRRSLATPVDRVAGRNLYWALKAPKAIEVDFIPTNDSGALF